MDGGGKEILNDPSLTPQESYATVSIVWTPFLNSRVSITNKRIPASLSKTPQKTVKEARRDNRKKKKQAVIQLLMETDKRPSEKKFPNQSQSSISISISKFLSFPSNAAESDHSPDLSSAYALFLTVDQPPCFSNLLPGRITETHFHVAPLFLQQQRAFPPKHL